MLLGGTPLGWIGFLAQRYGWWLGLLAALALLPPLAVAGLCRGADLRGAETTLACFAGADLRGANLEGCCFAGSDLRGADLRWANLRRAWLAPASKLVAALVRDARWDDADLAGAVLPDDSTVGRPTGMGGGQGP